LENSEITGYKISPIIGAAVYFKGYKSYFLDIIEEKVATKFSTVVSAPVTTGI